MEHETKKQEGHGIENKQTPGDGCILCFLENWWNATVDLIHAMRETGLLGETPEEQQSTICMMTRDLEKAWMEFFCGDEDVAERFSELVNQHELEQPISKHVH